MTISTPITPAGWYPDPAGSPRSRWWDGAQWSEHFYDPATGVPAQGLTAPDGIAVWTPWIWLIIFLPLLSLSSLFSIDLSGYLRAAASGSTSSSLAMMSSPGYLLSVFGGWGIYALCALFAFLDWRQLKAVGVARPFHFAWVFLYSPVYAIGRSVVVRRRTGRGIATMWAQIAVIVAILAISIGWTGYVFSVIFQSLSNYRY